MHPVLRSCGLPLLSLLLVGCHDEPVGPGPRPPVGVPAAGRAGLMEVTITGIGTPQQRASVSAVVTTADSAAGGGPGRGGPQPGSSARRSGRLQTLPDTAASAHDGTVQLEPVSTASFTLGARGAGGYRYVSATYRVRNAAQGGAAYANARTNLTFLAVSTPGTLSGTALSTLLRFDGSGAAAGLATQILPSGWADLSGTATLTAKKPDVLQAYPEADVAALPPPAGVTDLLPYGFVVSNPGSVSSRTLPANPGTTQFDGLVTFAFKVPLQATAADDPFTISAMFLPVDDNQVWVTQSPEEGDAPSVAALTARAAALGGQVLIPDNLPACRLRAAGTAASPTAFMSYPMPAIVSQSPSPYTGAASFLAGTASFGATFDRAMAGATNANFVVNSLQGGRAFLAGSYTGAGTATLGTPAGSFRPGDEVEVALTKGLLGAASTFGLCSANVVRYRVAAAAASAGFSTGGPYPVGFGPASAALGDLNGDGKLDLVTANSSSSNVTVLLGNGGGGFNAANGSPFAVGQMPQLVVLGDVNGDGAPDVVTANRGLNDVTVLLGDGAGAYSPASGSPFAVGSEPAWVALGDVNGDGKQDLVTANSASDNVTVLLGNGAGGFAAASGSPFAIGGVHPVSVALGDVNGDGKLDLVTANFTSQNVSVLLGTGAGSFGAASGSPFAIGVGPSRVALGDVNGDAKLDLVASSATSNNVTLLLGDGSGGFSAAAGSPFAVGTVPVSVALGDVNGDSRLDIVTANNASSNVSVLLGNGTGGFSAASGSPFTVGSNPGSVALGDVNGDGKLDLVTSHFNLQNVSVLLGSGTGGFTAHVGGTFAVGSGPGSVALGDVNGDGLGDLAVANLSSNNVTVLLRTVLGSYTAAPGSPIAVGSGAQAVALADANGDGVLDLIVAQVNTVLVLLGTGSGAFSAAPGSPFAVGSGPASVAVGDVNGDGKVDLVTANANSQNVTVLLGNGTGGFAAAAGSPFAVGSGPEAVALGDANRDGRLDIITANSGSNNVSVLLGNGTGGFATAAGSPFTVGSVPTSVAVGDVNGDGKLDVVTANASSDNVTVLLGNGSGGFSAASGSPFAVGSGPRSVTLGDVNGDGKLDLVTANLNADNVTVLMGNGSGGFTAVSGSPFGVGSEPVFVTLGDVNGDGRLDLVVVNNSSDNVTVLVNP